MNLTYFYDIATFDDAKKLYRQLAKRLHPDHNLGVDKELIQELNEQWEYIQNNEITYPVINPNKRVVNQPNRNERLNVIKALEKIRLAKGYQRMWLYHQYLTECKKGSIKVEQYDIRYIGDILGYSEFWADIKIKELGI